MDIVHSRTFIERGIYNVNEVKNLIIEHKKIVESRNNTLDNHMMVIWQLVNLEAWLN